MAEPIGAGPRAFFLCEACHAKGKMPEPVELLTAAKHCPLCGKVKSLSRMWSGYSPMIATNGNLQKFRAADATVEATMLQADARKDAALRAEQHARRAESVVPGIDMRVRAISTEPARMAKELGGFGAVMGGVARGKAEVVGVDPSSAMSQTQRGAQKILSYGRRNAIHDPNPQETQAAIR